MIIIGERINSTRVKVRQAIKDRDSAFIVREARAQADAGAQYIDVNCAVTSSDEVQDIDWVINVLQDDMPHIGISIDSPNYLAIERALSVYKADGALIVNSITAEADRIERILPLVKRYQTKVIALTMDESGMPTTAEDRVRIVKRILEMADTMSIKASDIFFDPLIRPVSTEADQPLAFMKSLNMIKALGDVCTVCGLSNVSFGLPARSVMNTAFASMAIAHGLGAAIVDPLDKRLMGSIYAAEALMGNDEYCAQYLKAFRSGKLDV